MSTVYEIIEHGGGRYYTIVRRVNGKATRLSIWGYFDAYLFSRDVKKFSWKWQAKLKVRHLTRIDTKIALRYAEYEKKMRDWRESKTSEAKE